MSYKTPMQRVWSLGSAKDGTEHFVAQRITALALLPLSLIALSTLASAMGDEWLDVRATYASPFNAIVAILFIATAFHHLKLGLQVVIEDYVHGHAWKAGWLLFNSFFCWGLGLAGVFAVAKLAFSA